jgi:nicotinamidase-related amidase
MAPTDSTQPIDPGRSALLVMDVQPAISTTGLADELDDRGIDTLVLTGVGPAA